MVCNSNDHLSPALTSMPGMSRTRTECDSAPFLLRIRCCILRLTACFEYLHNICMTPHHLQTSEVLAIVQSPAQTGVCRISDVCKAHPMQKGCQGFPSTGLNCTTALPGT